MWREYKPAPTGLDDLTNYAFVVAPGVMLLKDGALLVAYHFYGPDLDYAAPEETERLSAQVSAAFTRCGDGWMLHVDMIRRPAMGYMPPGAFPDPTSALIDEERRRQYSQEGHYESIFALALTYVPPPDAEAKVASLFYEGPEKTRPGWELVLESFTRTISEIEDMLGGVLHLVRMSDEELLTYLHLCVTGVDQPIRTPEVAVDLDTIIADQDLVGGFTPKLGDQHVRVLSIDGYPRMTEPDAQGFLHDLPMSYRWSTRFIFLDRIAAEGMIEKKRQHWWQKRHSFGSVMGEAAHGEPGHFERADSVDMALDANVAAAEAASGEVIYGLYTMTVVVMHEDEARVEMMEREVQKHVQRHGFGVRKERANGLEALLGSWPGHGYQNVRRVPMHSMNLADLLPLTSIWAGLETNPNPYLASDSPSLMLTATNGQTPFRLNLDVHDVRHGKLVGPTGSGKSVLVGVTAAQWLRYPDAQVFWFDKGYASFILCRACGGNFYDIGADETVAFCPLAQVNDEAEREWALEWLEDVLST